MRWQPLFSLFNMLGLLALAGAFYGLQWVQRPLAKPAEPKLEMVELHPVKMTIYYPDTTVTSMKPTERTAQVTQENDGTLAQAAVNLWATAPSGEGVLGVVPKGTPAPKVYVRSGHYFVDFPAVYTKLNYSTSAERMLLCTLTRTLLEKKGQDVTFLVGGQNAETLGYMDLRQPYTRQDCQDE